ncbi:MAG: Hpt domain-containing protein [Terracidiphilus sp.]|jgi:HPt (histidine-containing phosphotransfer) domain-containing protein
MDRPNQPGAPPQPKLTEALDGLWARFLPEMKQRIAVLESAASAVTQENLNASDREAAHAAAHKLAGVLGTFGLKRGSDLAHELEISFSPQSAPDGNSGNDLEQTVAELRSLIENRKSTF